MLGDQDTCYSLICAVREGRLERVRELIGCYGLSFSQAWSEGYVLLCDAVKNEHTEVAKLLLTSGCKVNSKSQTTGTPLHYAVINGDIEIVKLLLDRGADINAENQYGATILHCAVLCHEREIIELLVTQGADVNTRNSGGLTPLHLALKKCRAGIIKLLLSRDADVNAKGKDGENYIHMAVERGDLQMVKLLLECGPNVDAQDKDGKTALHLAVEKGQEKLVKLLLECGANVDAEDKDGKTVLHFAVEKGSSVIIEHVLKHRLDVNNKSNRSALNVAVQGSGEEYGKIVENLLQYGFTVSPEDVNNSKLLLAAVEKGYVKIVEELLKCGIDVNKLYKSTYGKGYMPLHVATENRQEEVAKLLISYGADVNAQDETGKTAIFYATENADLKIIELLLTNKANVKDNPELLNVAVKKECREIVEGLLEHGADVNTSDECGRTALHFTALEEEEGFLLAKGPDINVKGEIAKLLLIRGANVNAQTKNGITTLHAATYNGYAKVVEALLEHNADVNCKFKTDITAFLYDQLYYLDSKVIAADSTPLHIAAHKGHLEVVEVLLKFGAIIDSKDEYGRTALHIAANNGHLEVVNFLLECGANVDAEDENDKTVLHFAVKRGSSVIVECVLKYCPDVNNKSNRSALNAAVQGSGKEYGKIVENLLQYGFTVSPEDVNNCELLHAAVEKGYLKIVEELLKCGIDVNKLYKSTYGKGYMPLHVATKNRQEEVAKLLISYGADVNAQDETGKAPIFYAIQNADLKITELLLTNKANVKDNPELLNVAVKKKCREIVEVLLELGADVNTSDEYGTTALHFTALGEDREFLHHEGPDINVKVEIAKLLLSRGANVNAQTKHGITTLHAATQIGYVKFVEALLKHNADVNCRFKTGITAFAYAQLCYLDSEGKYGRTALHIAAQEGHLEMVNVLLKFGAGIDSKDEYGRTALHFAAWNVHLEVVNFLLECGANVDAQDKDGKTALHFAVERGSSVIIECVLKHCPDVNNKSNRSALNVAVQGYGEECGKIVENLLQYGFTVNPEDVNNFKLLHAAVEKGYVKIVEELLKCGIDVNKLYKSTYGESYMPLHVATENRQEEVAKLLISYGADVNAQDETGKTAIFYATENADLKITELLLTNKANVKDNPELLNVAVKRECKEIVEVLLEHGADVNGSDGYGRTALHFTALGKGPDINVKLEMTKLLLIRGANVNAQTKDGITTLHAATLKGYVKVIEALLEHNADVNCRFKTGITAFAYARLCYLDSKGIAPESTPLHIAAHKGHLEIVRGLLKFGAGIDSKDIDGRTALHIAAQGGHLEMVNVLLKFGAGIDSKDIDGRTALHIAAQKCRPEMVNVLLKFGADIDSKDKNGSTPLHIAAENGYLQFVEILVKFGASIDSQDEHGRTAFHIASAQREYQIVKALLEHGSDINIMPKTQHHRRNTISKFKNIKEVQRHIIKMKTANLFVSEQNLCSISSNEELRDFQKECEEEIASMKSEKFSNANFSFYDTLTKGISQLAMYAGNESIVQNLRSGVYKIKFPIYASMINCNFRKGERRKELVEQGNKIFHFLFKSFPLLPPDCTEKIFSYLSDENLRILIHACKPISVSSTNTDINNVAINSNIPKVS